MAVAAPVVAPQPPLKTDFRRMSRPPDTRSYFGTDQVGRDTLSRVIHGARTSLFVAFASVLLGTTVGSLWGLACGYLGGRFDLTSQRVMEILQSFPDLILAMAISMAIGTGMPPSLLPSRSPHPLRRAGDPVGGPERQGDDLWRGPTVERGVPAPDHWASTSCRSASPPISCWPRRTSASPSSSRRRSGPRGRIRRRRRRGGTARGFAHFARSTLVARVFPRTGHHGHRPRVQPVGDGIRDTLDPRLSPAFLRMMTGGRRAGRASSGGPDDVIGPPGDPARRAAAAG